MITVLELKALTQTDVGRWIFDGSGLRGIVRKAKEGRTRVFFEYRFRNKETGKIRSVKVGTWPDMDLKEIRAERDCLRVMIANGKDPVEENQISKLRQQAEQLQRQVEQAQEIERQQAELARLAAEQATRRTVKDALQQWYELALSSRRDKGAETIRAFAKDVIPTIGDIALPDVTKTMIINLLDDIVRRGARRMANRNVADLKQFFEYCINKEWILLNPISKLTKTKVGGKESERDRVLSENEIKELAAKLPTANLQRSTERALWIMLSTCCRVGELSKARWEHIDLNQGWWRIPSNNAKNAREHTIYLSTFALSQFKELHSINGGSEWCYPAEHRDGHVCLKSITKQVHDRQRATALRNRTKATGTLLLSGGEWTVHDLRRTGATLMGELGVIPEVIERCLNHLEQNRMKRTYQRHELRNEKREAWQQLGERLSLLTVSNTDNVIIGRFRETA
jgi:integrase